MFYNYVRVLLGVVNFNGLQRRQVHIHTRIYVYVYRYAIYMYHVAYGAGTRPPVRRVAGLLWLLCDDGESGGMILSCPDVVDGLSLSVYLYVMELHHCTHSNPAKCARCVRERMICVIYLSDMQHKWAAKGSAYLFRKNVSHSRSTLRPRPCH